LAKEGNTKILSYLEKFFNGWGVLKGTRPAIARGPWRLRAPELLTGAPGDELVAVLAAELGQGLLDGYELTELLGLAAVHVIELVEERALPQSLDRLVGDVVLQFGLEFKRYNIEHLLLVGEDRHVDGYDPRVQRARDVPVAPARGGQRYGA